MAHNNGIITAPISPDGDVSPVLSENSGDIGTLCTSQNINMWSKVKPVRSSSQGVDPSGVPALMKSADFGLGIDSTQPLFDTGIQWMMSCAQNRSGKWAYRRPTTRYRLLDFHGYDHNTVDAPPAVVNFIYDNSQQYPDQLQVLFSVNEHTPIQMRDFTEMQEYAPVDAGGFRYVVLIDKTGTTGSSQVDFDIIIGPPFFVSSDLAYYSQGPGPNASITIDMSPYPANSRVCAGIMRIMASSSNYSYGRWCVLYGGYYNYVRSSIADTVSLRPAWRGFDSDSYGLTELRFSVFVKSGYNLTNLTIVSSFYHSQSDSTPFYVGGANLAAPVQGSYLTMDLTGSPTRIQGSDYMTIQYTYYEDGVLKTYYFDFKYSQVKDTPYQMQQIL